MRRACETDSGNTKEARVRAFLKSILALASFAMLMTGGCLMAQSASVKKRRPRPRSLRGWLQLVESHSLVASQGLPRYVSCDPTNLVR